MVHPPFMPKGLLHERGPINLISRCSKKQPLIARSGTDAEYWNMANTTAEIFWIRSILTELGTHFTTPMLFCDNLSADSLSHNPVLHSRTKHMELDMHFVRKSSPRYVLISQRMNQLYKISEFSISFPFLSELSNSITGQLPVQVIQLWVLLGFVLMSKFPLWG